MSRALHRTLAVRFALTMGVGLSGAAIALSIDNVLLRPFLLGFIVVIGTFATFVGAWRLARSAVRPVEEITAQATRIEAGTLDQRLVAESETDEYRGLVAVLNRMLERIDSAFRAQRRLTASVSHEFRTPLTAMQGEMEVALRAERTPREYQRVLRSVLEETERLSHMCEDLLWLTRAESRLITARPALTDLNVLVRDLVERYHPRFAAKGFEVRAQVAAPRLQVDAALVTKLLEELLDNALEHTPPGGSIEVGAAEEPFGVRMWVEDSGSGIAPADLPHIFEPFYRADPARSRGSGAGLGLSVALAIARMHGGGILAGNGAEGGARFEVELPRQSPMPEVARRASASVPAA